MTGISGSEHLRHAPDGEGVSTAVIGPGAIGAALAGGLVEAGGAPVLVARTAFDRLRVEWPSGSLDVDANCVSEPGSDAARDLVVVATKATQNHAIGDHIRALTAPGSALLVAQNGVDHADRFAEVVDAGVDIVPAIVMLPSERVGPGSVRVGRPSRLIIPEGPGAALVASAFAGSFIDVDLSPDWTTAAWHKLLLNASVGGIGVLARRGSDAFDDADALDLMLALMEEVAEVGRAEGAKLATDVPAQLQRYQREHGGSHTTSIVLDRLAGRPTEWRERNQVVVLAAEKHGIDVPVNRAVATLMRLGEPSTDDHSDDVWLQPGSSNDMVASDEDL